MFCDGLGIAKTDFADSFYSLPPPLLPMLRVWRAVFYTYVYLFLLCTLTLYLFFPVSGRVAFFTLGSPHPGVRQGVARAHGLQAVPDPATEPLLVDSPAPRWQAVEPQQLPHGYDPGTVPPVPRINHVVCMYVFTYFWMYPTAKISTR